ncbi:hypothetical protein [Pseudomonas sp. LRF_L74]|uniref:hypothetical protein n=1 Tax=Pseudomonas sp. LRF_L74 TaxID=3369422 RepID=UPI003F5FBB67
MSKIRNIQKISNIFSPPIAVNWPEEHVTVVIRVNPYRLNHAKMHLGLLRDDLGEVVKFKVGDHLV